MLRQCINLKWENTIEFTFDMFRIDRNATETGRWKASTSFMLLFSLKVKTVFSF